MKTTFLPEVRLPVEIAPPSETIDDFVMPCSMDQQRFWVLEQLAPGNAALNVPVAVELKGLLNVDALHKALNAVIQRHEALRTSFAWIDGEVKQVISPAARFYFQHKNLASISEAQRSERLLQEMHAEAQRPLSLTKAPIFRARLLHFGAEDHVLLFTLHHIICDGWATGVLVNEVGVFYQAILEGKPAVLPELPIQYADYAVWQHEWLKTPDFQSQLSFWEKQLADSSITLDFPTDHPRLNGRKFPGFIEHLLLPLGLTDEVKRMCQELDVTMFTFLFATFATLLHRYTGQSRFIVGTTVANRPRPELENLVGQFSNPMMLRADLADEPTFRELVHRMSDLTLGAMTHPEVPFESIVERLESKLGGRQKPTIQTLFLFQKDFMQPAKYGELTFHPLRWVSPGIFIEFSLVIVERAEGICLHLEYNTALLENATVRRMLRHFKMLLEAAVENPDTPVSELSLLTEEERAKMWPPLPSKELSAKDAPIGSPLILKSLQSQLIKHFREATDPRGVVIQPPPGVILVVLDRHLRLLPAGIPGELYLGGVSSEMVPGTTLVSGPLDSLFPIPLLRTEFVSQNREDGKIELLGQARDFAQVNGFRINLRQIKALLLRHPGVLDAAAVVFQQPSGENQLICYIVPEPGSSPAEAALRALLKGEISDFTLPSHIVTVSSLTRGPQGEVITELLPKPLSPSKLAQDDTVPMEAILYQQLIEIWLELLQVPSVTIEDNFFALGGTSLLAFRMMIRIEKLCGRLLPLSLLLTGATIANLARFIIEANNESATPLVTVQANGDSPPLFFMHGDWAGGGFYCGRLAQPLGEEQPFYALSPYRLGKSGVLTMEDMAAHHIAAIQEHTPHGPYLLGGYCIGATVAMEISRQLVEKGEKVTHLLLIDPPPWSTSWLRWAWLLIDKGGEILKWDVPKKIHCFDLYAVSLDRWLMKSPSGKLTSIRRRLGLLKSDCSNTIPAAREAGEGDREILKSLDYAIYFLSYRIYRPKPLSVSASVYFPEADVPSHFSWMKRVSEKFTVEIVPGDHQTCITKHVFALGEKMKNALTRL